MIYPAEYDIVVLQNATFSMRVTAASSGTPINLSGYTIDGDICYANSQEQIASFSSSVISAPSGIFDLVLEPSKTADFSEGQYRYDLSATSPGGERYYWLKGSVTVSGTCSRN
jgi:hypothetical protein